jgi:amidase
MGTVGRDTTWLDATAQAELVRRGDATPIELVEAAIDRIERVDPAINAVIHPRFEAARKEAVGDLPDGPFRGVPLLLKDLGPRSAGDPYHAGNLALKRAGTRGAHDSSIVRRLRAAGFVVVGRTNVPENGSIITTEPVAYGPARNPWDPDHSTGGSSGGSAAAVAAGCTPVAHANDGGGSIRIPAANCGLVGLKPSRGRVTQAPEHGEQWMGGVVDGAVTRTVRDTAAVLDVLAGYEVGDPYVAPSPARPFVDEVDADPGRLRIGVLDRPLTGVAGHADVGEAVAVAGRLLESLGHDVVVGHPEAMADPAFAEHFAVVAAVGNALDFSVWEQEIGRPLADDELEPYDQMLRAIGESVTAPRYLGSVDWLHAFTRRMAAWWEVDGWDLLVTPVLNGPPPPLGWLSDPAAGLGRLIEIMQFTAQFNMTGQPAVSLPLHWNGAGLPIGVQLVAAYGREDLLIRVAAQLEAAAPWAERHPPVHA